MEPERKIEKLLRAFAKKRREQAGDAMEMRPAARQRLLGEVRRRSQRSGGGFLSSLFALSRPKLAFAFCVLAMVCAGVWLLMPLRPNQKSSDTLSLASADTRRAARAPMVEEAKSLPAAPPAALETPAPALPPAPAAAPAPQPVVIAPGSLANGATAPPLSEVAIGAVSAANDAGAVPKNGNETKLSYQAAAPAEPLAANRSADLAGAFNRHAAGPEGTAITDSGVVGNRPQPGIAPVSSAGNPSTTGTNFALAMDQSLSDVIAAAGAADKDTGTIAMAPAATGQRRSLGAAEPGPAASAPAALAFQKEAAAPPASGVGFDSFTGAKTSQNEALPSQRFYRVDIAAARERAILAPQNPAPILSSFRVEQDGRELRVLDADGSIYTGTVQVARDKKLLGDTYVSTLKGESAVALATKPGSPVQPQLAVQNYFFLVSGTNRNLKQLVTFSGNFIPLTNAGPLETNPIVNGFGGASGGGGGATPNLPAQLLLNSRISGKAVIGSGKEIEVNAAPARR